MARTNRSVPVPRSETQQGELSETHSALYVHVTSLYFAPKSALVSGGQCAPQELVRTASQLSLAFSVRCSYRRALEAWLLSLPNSRPTLQIFGRQIAQVSVENAFPA
jgi:hypothetical protein